LVRGCPRSGTTYVAELINTSPEAAILVEYPLGTLIGDLRPILAYGRAYRMDVEAFDRSRLTLGLRASTSTVRPTGSGERSYGLRAVDRSVPRFPTEERFAAVVAGVVSASLGKSAVRTIGSKTPGLGGAADRAEIEPLFSNIRYVFVVRSPLGTINSMINRRNLTRAGADQFPWTTVDECIAEYRQNIGQLFSHAARYPEACFVVKFEDLLARFDETARGLGAFLALEFETPASSMFGPDGLRPQGDPAPIVLDDGELETVRDAFGAAIDGWDEKQLSGPATAAVAALADCVEVFEPGTKYPYQSTRADRPFLGLGWSFFEDVGVWTDGERADLVFRVPRDGRYAVYAETSYFLPEQRPALQVSLDVNGAETFRATFIAGPPDLLDATRGPARIVSGEGRKSVLCGPVALDAGRAHQLTFRFGEARSPLELGISGDPRRIGALLHSLLLVEA